MNLKNIDKMSDRELRRECKRFRSALIEVNEALEADGIDILKVLRESPFGHNTGTAETIAELMDR